MGAAVIVVAAGRGTRLGASVPKALVPLLGEPLVTHAVRRVSAAQAVTRVVVVHPAGARPEFEAALAGACSCPLTLVPGGAERSDSVRNGLAALSTEDEVVLVHDAARCLAPPELVDAVAAAVAGGAAAVVPGLPVADTIKQVDAEGYVVATPVRSTLRAVQTPQGFDRPTLEAAHASGLDATDDAALVEAAGGRVLVVPGHEDARKVTTPADLTWAEQHLAR